MFKTYDEVISADWRDAEDDQFDILYNEWIWGLEEQAAHEALYNGFEPEPEYGDWCDICEALQMVLPDGSHACGEIDYESFN